MAFGFEHWKTTPAGIEAATAMNIKRSLVIAAAKAGIAPIRIIAPDIEHFLGDRTTNSHVGRLVREWLGPKFELIGRMRWSRENGTESGSLFFYIG
jgi:hypothetical protein